MQQTEQVEYKRALASVKRIDSIEAIPEADALEVAVVGGWKVVTRKGEFNAGDLALMLEVDSWVPTALAPFLSKGKEPRVFNSVQGERLKTIRLRGQISQGLLIKPDVDSAKGYFWNTPDGNRLILSEGDDLTELLGVLKWEAPEEFARNGSGKPKGNFPVFIRKTDQERLQNLKLEFEKWTQEEFDNFSPELLWEVTEKLDGSSMTVFSKDGVIGVCSRNLELKREDEEQGNFWKTALNQNLDEILTKIGRNLAFQGELCGPGIQKNPYKLTETQFFLFDIYDIDNQRYLSPAERSEIAEEYGLQEVPYITAVTLCSQTLLGWIDLADSESAVNASTTREGLVFKRLDGSGKSFKVISNAWLLKSE